MFQPFKYVIFFQFLKLCSQADFFGGRRGRLRLCALPSVAYLYHKGEQKAILWICVCVNKYVGSQLSDHPLLSVFGSLT